MAILIRNNDKISDFQKEKEILDSLEEKFKKYIQSDFFRLSGNALTIDVDYQKIPYDTLNMDIPSLYQKGISNIIFKGDKNFELINTNISSAIKYPISYINKTSGRHIRLMNLTDIKTSQGNIYVNLWDADCVDIKHDELYDIDFKKLKKYSKLYKEKLSLQYEVFSGNEQFLYGLLEQLYTPYVHSKKSFYSEMVEDLPYGFSFDYGSYLVLIKNPQPITYYINHPSVHSISRGEWEHYKEDLYFYVI